MTRHQYEGWISRSDLDEVRDFVDDWLERDAHGFVIPGGEWGLELKASIQTLIAATQRGDDYSVIPDHMAASMDSVLNAPHENTCGLLR